MSKWLAVPALLVITLIIWTATTQITRETILNETQAASRVETFYNGDVQHTIKKGAHYFITFKTAHGIYEVAVDEENGRFSQLHFIHALTTLEEKPAPSEVAPRMTAEQVRILAKQAYPGEIEEIIFRDSADGGYYLVDMDTENEEIILQIHAVTGKILSVSFEE